MKCIVPVSGDKIAVCGGDGTIALFHVDGNFCQSLLKTQLFGSVNGLSVSRDGIQLLAATDKGFIYRVRGENGSEWTGVVPANDTIVLNDVTSGPLEIQLGGVAPNCQAINDGGTRLSVDLDPIGGLLGRTNFSDGDTWVDPMIGAKARLNISDGFYLTGWGLVGGFDVGSDLTWDAMGAVGYEATNSVSLIAGYRALGVDYSSGPFLFDVVESGPIVGASIKF